MAGINRNRQNSAGVISKPLRGDGSGTGGVVQGPLTVGGNAGKGTIQKPLSEQQKKEKKQWGADIVLLAATAFGEASSDNVYEEVAAIANVIVRQSKARSVSLKVLLGPANTYAFAASNGGNERFRTLKKASSAKIENDKGMKDALKAAQNALNGGTDYSNGAYFWDGVDLKTNYANHPKVRKGIKFADPKHNIFDVKEKEIVEVVVHWQHRDKKGKVVNGKERGRYKYTYISTAAYGKTVFWRYSDEFLQATGNSPFQ